MRDILQRHRSKLKILVAATLGAALLLWLLPIGVRLGAVHWLEGQGLTAQIEDIDLNLFTGELAITGARGESVRGDGFRIGHLRANLDYWPLFWKQVYLSSVEWRDTRIDIHRSQAGHIAVAGLPIIGDEPPDPPDQPPDDDAPWGFGVDKAAIEAVTLRYVEPDFTRSVTLASSQTRDVTTWDTATPLHLDADVAIGDARVRVEGDLKPFGRRVTGDLRLRIDDFGLSLVAPLLANAGVARLAGVIGTDLRVGLDYRPAAGLSVRSEGGFSVQDAELAGPDIEIERGGMEWQGHVNANLLRADGTDTIDADGNLAVSDLDLRVPETLSLAQSDLSWQGQAEVALRTAGPSITTDGTLQIAGTKLGFTDGSLTLAQDQASWQGTARADVEGTGTRAQTDGRLTMTGLDLNVAAAGIALQQSAVNWQGTAAYASGEPAIVRSDGKLALSGTRVRLAEASLAVAGNQLTWEGRAGIDVQAEGVTEATLPLILDGGLSGEGLVVDDLRRDRTLARVNNIQVQSIAARGLADIGLATLEAAGIDTFQRPDGAPKSEKRPYTIRLDALTVNEIGLRDMHRLNVRDVQASGVAGYMLRREDGNLEFLDWLANVEQRTAAGPEQSPADPAADGDAFTFAVGDVFITGDSEMVLADRTVAPDFEMRAGDIEAALRSLDSANPDQSSPVRLEATVGRYGNVRVEGKVKPLKPKPSLTLKGTVEALNLSPLSGYVATAIERRVAQGILDAKLDLDVTEGAIDGEADLTLAKFRLSGVVGDSGAVERSLGLPMDKALDLLRDGDGNVNMSLPLGGDLANPTFSIAGVLRKAVLKGIQVAVLSYYSPLGVLKVGKKLVDLATALRFEPVGFAAGQATLDGNDRAYLDKMANLLADRPQARLVVCGHAVPADRNALALPPTEENPEPAPETLRDARDRLLELARQRSQRVGDYLVAQGIEAGRLVLCNPELGEGGDAEPRTTISF